MTELAPSAARVQAALTAAGLGSRVRELPASTRTAVEAAAAVGCTVAQIVKSLVFRTVESGRAVLVLASGTNRVDENRLAELLGERVAKADAPFVREQTGYAIGGVPPVAHAQALETLIDADLFGHAELWAAAGTPQAVFPLTPAELLRLAHGRVAEVKTA
jgi:prolyl-tRNA editing enzyme YbaK/EbsC (Cys-tRNA(Pro) deacylase)